jgi:hypothetical protein
MSPEAYRDIRNQIRENVRAMLQEIGVPVAENA